MSRSDSTLYPAAGALESDILRPLNGAGLDPVGVLRAQRYPSKSGELFLMRDIDFRARSEHGEFLFAGRVHAAILPRRYTIPPGALARLIDTLAGHQQTQERLTMEIRRAIDAALAPRGVAVMLDAHHEMGRGNGAHRHRPSIVTCSTSGLYRDAGPFGEFVRLVRN